MNYVKNSLKFLRKKEALTQEQLATKIGVKRAMIVRMRREGQSLDSTRYSI